MRSWEVLAHGPQDGVYSVAVAESLAPADDTNSASPDSYVPSEALDQEVAQRLRRRLSDVLLWFAEARASTLLRAGQLGFKLRNA